MCENGKPQDQTGSNAGTLDLERGQKAKIETHGMAKNAKQVLSSGEPTHWEKNKNEAFKSSECKFKILVVDDSQNIREMLEDFLDFEGHQTILAKDGKEALNLFSEQDFDLVITDLGMPGMSGWKLSEHIKERKPGTPIIIITGWGAQLSDEDLTNNDVDLILPKPFHLDQVKRAIDTVAGKLSRQHEAGKYD
jgi:CheY-like chemotaxis protein